MNEALNVLLFILITIFYLLRNKHISINIVKYNLFENHKHFSGLFVTGDKNI